MQNNHYIKYSVFVIVFLLRLNLFAQDYSNIFSMKYEAKDFHSSQQIWTVEIGMFEMVYIGNNDGIMAFDGHDWNTYYVDNYSRVRCLTYDNKNKIYVGAVDEFGYLEYDINCNLKYKSLINLLPENLDFGEIWKINIVDDAIYYQADNYIFKFYKNKVTIIESPENNFFYSFYVNNNFYVQINNKGLFTILNDSLQLIENSEIFSKQAIFFMLPYYNKVLIGTQNSGISAFNPDDSINFSTLYAFNEINKELMDKKIYCALSLHNGNIAIGTLNGGLYIINKAGKIISNISDDNNSVDINIILNLKEDNLGNLWVASNKGVTYLELSSAISEFKYNSDISGNILAIEYYNEQMYLGTGLGVYVYDKNNLIKLDNISKQTWCFKVYNSEGDTTIKEKNILLAGTSDGLYSINNQKPEKLLVLKGIYSLFYEKQNPEILYVGCKSGIYILKYVGKKFIEIGKIPDINTEIWNIETDNKHNIWASSRYKGVYKIELKDNINELSNICKDNIEITNFNLSDGLPNNKDIMIYKFKTNLLFCTTEGIYRFDTLTNKFNYDSTLNNQLLFKNIYHYKSDYYNNIWLASLSNEKISIAYTPEDKKFIEWRYKAFLRMKESIIYDIEFIFDGNAWIASSDGIYLYDYNKDINEKYETTVNCLIKKITIGIDSVLFEGYTPGNSEYTKINFKNNSITFICTTTSFEDNSNSKYKYYLEGVDKEWSDWTSYNNRIYKKLKEGKYIFNVISKNVYGNESLVCKYYFIIEPPFYRTFYAYIFYIIMMFLMIYIIIKIYTKKLSIEKLNLERIINDRTEEISLKSRILEKQKEHIENQNQKLQQSYNDVQVLSEIGQGITSEITIENIVDEVYLRLHKLFDISVFGIGVYNKSKKIIEFFNYIDNNQCIPYKNIELNNSGDNIIKSYIQQKEIIVIKQNISENKTGEAISEIYLPLKIENKAIGVMVIKSDKIFYKEYHLNVLKNIAIYIEIALDNANAYMQLEKQKDEITQQAEKLVNALNEIKKTKQLIEEYNEELKKLSIVASKTDNAIMILSKRGEIEWVNDGFTKLYGFTYEEFTSKSKSIFVSATNKDFLHLIKSAIIEKKTVSYQAPLKNSANQIVWVQTTWTPILDQNGHLEKLIAIDSDVTKLKEAEIQISHQKDKIEIQNIEIKASMEYARKIQKAILSSENLFKFIFSDYFIISKPKDIISGDFYWTRQKDNLVFVAVADCTGHGVPGALMSVLGITFLDEIISNLSIEKPNDILYALREKLKKALKQNDKELITKDGIDISLFSYNIDNYEVLFSGAYHSLYILRANELIILKGDKMPIGYYEFNEDTFKNISVKVEKNDLIYLFTDGFSDQFGGEFNKKIKLNSFRNLLMGNRKKTLLQQKNTLENFFNDWKGDNFQVDDILILGLKI